MNLDFTMWKEYRLGDIFEIKKGKRLTSEDQIDGCTPYIGAIDSNNGISNYIEQEPIHQGNTISLSYNGSVGEAFYQPNPFWATDDVNVLYFRQENGVEFNVYIAMFICTVLRREKYRYCYGRKWVLDSMKETKILLPSKFDAPDWSWMEDYIKSLNCKSIKTANKKKTDLLYPLYADKWQYFNIDKLFDVSLSKGDIKIDDVDKGDIPLVSSGETNNGIVGYIDKSGDGKAETFQRNKITIDMFCNAFYQPYLFYAVSHGRVNILSPKFEMSKYSGLFIATLLKNEQYKYSYGRAVYSTVAAGMRIKLPVKADSNGFVYDETHEFSDAGYIPDWDYMENYIKTLPYGDRI